MYERRQREPKNRSRGGSYVSNRNTRFVDNVPGNSGERFKAILEMFRLDKRSK